MVVCPGGSYYGLSFINEDIKVAEWLNSLGISAFVLYYRLPDDATKENPDPNYLEACDVKYLKQWVRKGGVLLLTANDSPNCEFNHLNRLAKVFGFWFHPQTLNPVTNQQREMASETNLTNIKIYEFLYSSTAVAHKGKHCQITSSFKICYINPGNNNQLRFFFRQIVSFFYSL